MDSQKIRDLEITAARVRILGLDAINSAASGLSLIHIWLHQNKRRRHPPNNIYKRGPRAEPDRLRRAVHRLR